MPQSELPATAAAPGHVASTEGLGGSRRERLSEIASALEASYEWMMHGKRDSRRLLAAPDMLEAAQFIREQIMTEDEKNARIEELSRTLAYANSLGVRAELCGDAAQRAEAARIYSEAKAELEQLKSAAG